MIKNSFVLLLLLLWSSSTLAQDSLDPNGYNIMYYPNGKVLSEGYMKDGKPDGYWKTYYTTGILKSEGRRKNFLLDSTWVFYNSVGDTISKINYLGGKKNGYYYEYITNRSVPEYVGNISSKELYINGLKEGVSYYYYENGTLKEEAAYVGNKLDGLVKEYASDGRLITIKRYSRGSLVERQRVNRYNKEGKKAGEWVEFYDDNKVKKEIYYKDGKLDGYYKEYNEKGSLTLTLLYEADKMIQQVDEEVEDVRMLETESEDGTRNVGAFSGDKPIGIHKTYSKDGDVIRSKVYNDLGTLIAQGIIDREGMRQGLWKEYYNNGDLKASGKYQNNRKEGIWRYYHKNGVLEQEGAFRRGREQGEWKRYYENGDIFVEESYFNGKEEGLYTEYDSTGQVVTQGEYLEGEREGEWTVEINDYKSVGKYISGLKNERWKSFYDNGDLLFEGNYLHDRAEGKHKYFYSGGRIKEERYYSSGIPVKHWKKYDEFGNLIITISYKGGKEYRINGEKIDLPDDNRVLIK